MDFRTEILWAEFHDGYTDIEKYIEGRTDFCNPSLNFERTNAWDYAARSWWASDYYKMDRKLYQHIYNKLIGYYEDGIICYFDINLPDWDYPCYNMSINVDLNEEKVNTDETCVFIEGTDKTIQGMVDEFIETLKRVIV